MIELPEQTIQTTVSSVFTTNKRFLLYSTVSNFKVVNKLPIGWVSTNLKHFYLHLRTKDKAMAEPCLLRSIPQSIFLFP